MKEGRGREGLHREVGWWKYVGGDTSTEGFNAKARRRKDAKERSKKRKRRNIKREKDMKCPPHGSGERV